MLKLYEDQNITIRELQLKAGLACRTLYRYAKGEVNIKNMPMKTLHKVAEATGERPFKLYAKMVEYLELGKKKEKK